MKAHRLAESGHGAQLILVLVVLLILVLLVPVASHATTTETSVPFETPFLLGGERAGAQARGSGSESEQCFAGYAIRWAAVPGAESYTVKWHQDGIEWTKTGPASEFPRTYTEVPMYEAWDAPVGYLEQRAGTAENHSPVEYPERSLTWMCSNHQAETEAEQNPNQVTVKVKETTWVLSGTTDHQGSAPFPGVKVVIEGKAENEEKVAETVKSDEQGHWEIALPQGTYTVMPEGTGWQPAERHVILHANVSGANFTRGESTLAGKVLTAAEDPLANATVRASGQGGAPLGEATTNSEGKYSMNLPAGTYVVAPVPGNEPAGADEFQPEQCDGTKLKNACEIVLESEKESIADFTAGFTLSGKVSDSEGKPVTDATVVIQDTEQGKQQKAETTTNGEGMFQKRLAPGSVTASVKPTPEEFFPVPSEVCKAQNTSCEVKLDQDRQVEFAGCVAPNPDGSPLPANTPAEIPGAKTIGALEAVGCWTADPGSSNYSSTKPVRLDGWDVAPGPGVTVTIGPGGSNGAIVTSNGPVTVNAGGLTSFTSNPLFFEFPGLATSGMSLGDIESGTGGFGGAISILGLPVNVGYGTPLGNNGGRALLPWAFTPGQTTVTLAAQVGKKASVSVPGDAESTWNYADGAYEKNGKSVNSIGLQGSLELTNRLGLVLQGCFSPINDWEIWADGPKIEQFQFCYDTGKKQLQVTGLLELPESVELLKGIAIAGTLQSPGTVADKSIPETAIFGYKLIQAQIQFRGLGRKGLPLGEGVYLQRLGGGWSWDPNTNPSVETANLTGGISLGPALPLPGTETDAELLSADGQLSVTWNGTPRVWGLGGQITIAHGTPFELILGSGTLHYYEGVACEGFGSPGCASSPGRVDFSTQAHFGIKPIGGLSGLLTGFYVAAPTTPTPGVPVGGIVQAEGDLTAAAGPAIGTLEVLLHNEVIAVCAPGLAGAGFDYNMINQQVTTGCNIGTLRTPTPPPPTVKGSAARAAASSDRLKMPAKLSATTLALTSNSGTPLVQVSGPGTTIRSAVPGAPVFGRHDLMISEPKTHTTFVIIAHPRAGVWNVHALPGTPAITSIRQADAVPRTRIKAHIKPAQCRDTVSYKATVPRGESSLLVAQDGTRRVIVGHVRTPRGSASFPLDPRASGSGQLVALTSRGELPVSQQTVATFKDARSNGSEAPGAISLRGRNLKWRAACAAASYQVTITRKDKTTLLSTKKTLAEIPAGRGRVKVTVTALAATGEVLGSLTRTLA